MKLKRILLLVVHWAIIVNFVIEIAYAGYMVFTVLKPPGHSGPLFERALEIPHELMVMRRLYAIECWIAMAGLAIYLALTEIAPRLRRARADGGEGAS
jgi:hypothetical protein